MMLCACMAPEALFLVSAYRMKAFFTSSAASSSSGRAEQPAITSLPAGSSAEQPARNAVQLANAQLLMFVRSSYICMYASLSLSLGSMICCLDPNIK